MIHWLVITANLCCPNHFYKRYSTKSTVDFMSIEDYAKILYESFASRLVMQPHKRHAHTHTHGHTPTSSLKKLVWALKCTSGSCRSTEVVRQVPLATRSDCEILFLHCLPPEFRIRMSLHSSPLRDLFTAHHIRSCHRALIFTWRPERKGKNSLIYQFTSLLLWQYYSAFTNKSKTLLLLNRPSSHLANQMGHNLCFFIMELN